ncbi:MAG: hypothetical protein DRP11_02815 [Candidatus Aenigmatarchaeota archaeon]|nr:MAG: hypothetical protein DRP11_02815 [Candidatus Aenigmarchaeota archaeon]
MADNGFIISYPIDVDSEESVIPVPKKAKTFKFEAKKIKFGLEDYGKYEIPEGVEVIKVRPLVQKYWIEYKWCLE